MQSLMIPNPFSYLQRIRKYSESLLSLDGNGLVTTCYLQDLPA